MNKQIKIEKKLKTLKIVMYKKKQIAMHMEAMYIKSILY